MASASGPAQHDSDAALSRSRLEAFIERAPAILCLLRGPEHRFESFAGRPVSTRAVADPRALAFDKLTAVLGEVRARRIVDDLTTRLGVSLRDGPELALFASELTKMGGFEGAVGAMLGLQAVLMADDGLGSAARSSPPLARR